MALTNETIVAILALIIMCLPALRYLSVCRSLRSRKRYQDLELEQEESPRTTCTSPSVTGLQADQYMQRLAPHAGFPNLYLDRTYGFDSPALLESGRLYANVFASLFILLCPLPFPLTIYLGSA